MTHNLLAFPLPLLSPMDSGVELNLNHGHEKCQHLQHLKVKKKRHIFTFSECHWIYTGIYTNLIKWWTHNLIILETFENSLIFFLIVIFVFLESKSYSYTHMHYLENPMEFYTTYLPPPFPVNGILSVWMVPWKYSAFDN